MKKNECGYPPEMEKEDNELIEIAIKFSFLRDKIIGEMLKPVFKRKHRCPVETLIRNRWMNEKK